MGENETVPDNRQVTCPGAAPLYVWVFATAGPAPTPRNATKTAVAAATTIGAIGLRRLKTLRVCTVPLRRDANRPRRLNFDRSRWSQPSPELMNST